jgi:hypothetical protein
MKIRFNFKISRWANFYFFVQNLSAWHLSCRRRYNEHWRNTLPVFSEKQEELLIEFARIRKEHPEVKSVFEQAFFLSDDPLSTLEANLPKKEILMIREIFSSQKNNFNTIYSTEESKLEKWKSKLEESLLGETLNEAIIKELSLLFSVEIVEPISIRVFLLIAPAGHGGMVNMAENTITQDLSNLPLDYSKLVISTIWHETIHLCFEKPFFRALIKKHAMDREDRMFKYSEIIVSSLFPLGILGKKFFSLKITNDIYSMFKLNESQTGRIMNLTNKYVENEVPFDRAYLIELDRIIQKNG